MSEPINANDRHIEELLHSLGGGYWPEKHAALTALVAERNALKEENIALRSRQKSHQDEVLDRVFEMDALRKRIAELEAHPPANRDLHERLVCAIWPEIMREWREHNDAPDWRGWARLDALEEADKMLVAMRKGDTNA